VLVVVLILRLVCATLLAPLSALRNLPRAMRGDRQARRVQALRAWLAALAALAALARQYEPAAEGLHGRPAVAHLVEPLQ
jgi:hypothetical protein